MTYKNSKELMQQMAEKTGGTTLLAFGCGKDALSAWVELRKHFHTIIPVYYYLIPGLSFIENSLRYYEDFFKTRIIRLPNPHFYRMLNYAVFQTKQRWEVIKSFQLPVVKREELCQWVKDDFEIDQKSYTAIGNRAADNLMRQRAIKKFGAVNHKIKTFYPTYDYTIADVVKSIKEAGVKLPVDYRLFGKTFDGLDYRFIKPIKENYPNDYEKIRSFFPLLDIEIMRYEQL